MAGIDVLTYVSGKEVFILSGDGIEGQHEFDSYPEALKALKKIRAAKEEYERLRATQDKAVYREATTEALPEGFTLFVFRIGNEIVAGIVVGPGGYFARGRNIPKLVSDVWRYTRNPLTGQKPSYQQAPKGPGRM